MEVNCAVCSRQKLELSEKKSKILTNTTYLACNKCQEGGLEPRWIVALGYRAGNKEAERFIVSRLYPGKEISLREVLK